jgi:cytochrome c biogenesis protein CcmG, thiol:disulfide interchange protein DsbE
MRRSTVAGVVLIVLVCALVVVGLVLKPGSTTKAGPAPLIGHVAPDFSLRDARGKTVSLGTLRGHPLLLNFWATWCIPCRTEMPLISRVYAAHQRSLRVLAVDLQEPASDVNTFARDYHLAFVPLLDTGGTVWDLYHLSSNGPKPVTFWVDRQGVIRSIVYGEMTPKDLQSGLRRVGV